jgi:hypothetical protein
VNKKASLEFRLYMIEVSNNGLLKEWTYRLNTIKFRLFELQLISYP